MKYRKFQSFMKQFVKDDTAFGDLARDMKADSYFPENIFRWEDLLFYLMEKKADPKDLQVAEDAYTQFEEQKRQK